MTQVAAYKQLQAKAMINRAILSSNPHAVTA